MKKLTVIIPCYNEFKTINTIINKILEINFIETQIIVVDDKSTDGSDKIVENF